MMINDIERRQIVELQHEEDSEKTANIAKNSSNPCFLQQYAINYNWDDGFRLPKVIAKNQSCDLGTALTLFWLAEGMSYYLGEVARNEYNSDWADFCDLLVQKLLSNSYPVGPVSFKPSINKVTALKYEKNKVPKILYQEVLGTST